MAIYHLHAKILQRSKGKNAVAAAAYRRATKLYDHKEQRLWDYTDKKGVVHSELLARDDAPQWVKALIELHEQDPSQAAQQLWNQVEAAEKRIDSQLAREIEFALPIELDLEQNILLAREFIRDQFVLRGMLADWNVHWDEGNPHVHVMFTMRELTTSGFGKRVLDWNNRALLQTWREQWAAYANFHLRLHQHAVRIDHRSYEAQGIELIPTVHHGKAISDMARRGIETDIRRESAAIRQANLARICANPDILLAKLTVQYESFNRQQLSQEFNRYINEPGRFSFNEADGLSEEILCDIDGLGLLLQQESALSPALINQILTSIEHYESVFTERNLAKALAPYTENARHFAKALIQLKASQELRYLGVGDDGRDRFTTQRMFVIENEIQTVSDKLHQQGHVKFSSRFRQRVLANYQQRSGMTLTLEQQAAIKHILAPQKIACIVGRAGTGKSFLLSAAREVWEAKGLRVLGIALSGIAADCLQKEAQIVSRTIASFLSGLTTDMIRLTPKDVLVVDEAGMADSVSLQQILKAVELAGAKVVLVGDPAQLQPVGAGASFRALVERVGYAELQSVYRQKVAWQREATIAFSMGRVAEGLAAYDAHGCIHLAPTERDAMFELVTDWQMLRQQSNRAISEFLVIAHRNDDVHLLNRLLRDVRVHQQEIVEGYTVNTIKGTLVVACGDRLLFLKNDRTLGVTNGRFATVKQVDFSETGRVLHLTVVLDGSGTEVRIDPNRYNHFTYGYAATVHKTQGMTVDHTLLFAGGTSWNRHLTYVAHSRHRETCHLYADEKTHTTKLSLTKQLGRLGIKDSVLDFPLAFAERRNIDTHPLLKLLPKHLVKRLSELKNKVVDQVEQWLDPDVYYAKQAQRAEALLKTEQIIQRREDAKMVAQYADTRRNVGKAWQVLQQKLHQLDLDKLSYAAEEFAVISASSEYQRFLSVVDARNAIAAQLVIELDRYQSALLLYSVDIAKLTLQAEQHRCFERVKAYQLARDDVERDRLAAVIHANIKAHYAYIQRLGVSLHELKAQHTGHVLRQTGSGIQTDIAAAQGVASQMSLHTMMINYVGMELEQTALVNALQVSRLTKLPESQILRDKMLAHNQQLLSYAETILQHAEVRALLNNISGRRVMSLAEQGGFKLIAEQLAEGKVSNAVYETIINYVSNKVVRIHAQQQDRDRGGRTQ